MTSENAEKRSDGGTIMLRTVAIIIAGTATFLASTIPIVSALAKCSEMVPVDQSVSNWTEMVTVQIFYALKVTPAQFKIGIDKERTRLCPGSSSQSIAQGSENSYPAMVWYQNCSLNKATGKPEFTWFKAIQGNDSFYVVQLALKARPSEELITRWMDYFKRVRVCDTRLPDRACPTEAVPR